MGEFTDRNDNDHVVVEANGAEGPHVPCAPVTPRSFLRLAFERLRAGDTPGARSAVGVPASALRGDHFAQGLRALERGLSRVSQGFIGDALVPLDEGLPVVVASTRSELRDELDWIRWYVDGMARLFRGDGEGAVPLLERAADDIEAVEEHWPELCGSAAALRMRAYVAAAGVTARAGNRARAARWRALAFEQRRSIQKAASTSNSAGLLLALRAQRWSADLGLPSR